MGMRPEKLGYLICTKLAVSNLLPKKTRAEQRVQYWLYCMDILSVIMLLCFTLNSYNKGFSTSIPLKIICILYMFGIRNGKTRPGGCCHFQVIYS